MPHQFAQLAFTPTVRDVQTENGSRLGYASMDTGTDYNNVLSDYEAEFIRNSDSFYMATVSETGWPYVQHRGGPKGFVKVLDPVTLGFADYSGNRQYISTGNLIKDNRVSLFFMDYANKRRLKLLGRVELIGLDQNTAMDQIEDDHYRARIERGMYIRIEAFDWNCPQHITPRYTQEQVDKQLVKLRSEVTKANLVSDSEPRLTHETGNSVLGDGPLNLVISGIRQVTPKVRAYELSHALGEKLPVVQAGAYLTLPVVLSDGKNTTRSYSISSDPEQRDRYEIAVLREANGKGGSVSVHETYQLGMRLDVAQPINNLPVHRPNRTAILIAGGIGITPLKAMARSFLNRGVSFKLHFAGKSRADMPFIELLEKELGTSLVAYPASEGKRMEIDSIISNAPSDCMFYVCGPQKMINATLSSAELQGINPDYVLFERFEADKRINDQPFQVELFSSKKSVSVAANQTLLDALLQQGIEIPNNCRAGKCRSCVVKVVSGDVDHRDDALSPEDRDQKNLMCPCVSRASSGNITLDL